jgi:hypothetical protein
MANPHYTEITTCTYLKHPKGIKFLDYKIGFKASSEENKKYHPTMDLYL